MWKLVTAELMYVNGRFSVLMLVVIVIFTCIALLGVAIGDPVFIRELALEFGIDVIIIIYITKQIQLLFFEDQEKRVRLVCLAPVPKWQIALARIVNPTVILFAFMIITAIYIGILSENITETMLVFTGMLSMGIFVTYLMRLFSEKHAKIIAVCFFVLLFLGAGSLGNDILGLSIFVVVFAYCASNVWGAIVGSLVISGFLWWAFMVRRSYLK